MAARLPAAEAPQAGEGTSSAAAKTALVSRDSILAAFLSRNKSRNTFITYLFAFLFLGG
jgi:hypothetical protein